MPWYELGFGLVLAARHASAPEIQGDDCEQGQDAFQLTMALLACNTPLEGCIDSVTDAVLFKLLLHIESHLFATFARTSLQYRDGNGPHSRQLQEKSQSTYCTTPPVQRSKAGQ